MMENLHVWCQEIVRWAGNCPEATVTAWGTSVVLTVTHLVVLIKSFITGKEVPEKEIVEVPTPVNVPYMPGDTVVKLLRLMRNKNEGWSCTTNYDSLSFNSPADNHLIYGDLDVVKKGKTSDIDVYHKGIKIDLTKKSYEPEMDQILLKEVFDNRLRKEKARLRARNQQLQDEAELRANRELDNVLDRA